VVRLLNALNHLVIVKASPTKLIRGLVILPSLICNWMH